AFYRLAQDRAGFSGRLASAFCQGHAGRVGQNYAILTEGRGSERITDIALRYYSDDNLHGFGNIEFARADGKPLLEQQRGLVVPLVEKAIEEVRPAQVLEIGCANGDVLAHLASRHPKIAFVGVDLSVSNAERKHTFPNLRFVKGYALDLLRSGQIGGDVVFGNSTFCIFAPKELAAYMDALKDARQLVISDPVTWGNEHRAEPMPYSRHMDLYMWWHNYYGYVSAAGFTIDHFQTVNFAYSYNPGARVVLISGHR
ncbi:MAG: class I SAM-dependent methyltransferase, partial [Candidatus Binataceae bacterium]